MREIDRLLINWGRWSRVGAHERSFSNIQPILMRLKLYGKCTEEDEEDTGATSQGVSTINEADALRVDKAICKLPKVRWDDRQGIELLRMLYLTPWVSFPSACRQCHFTLREGRQALRKTKDRLAALLEIDQEIENLKEENEKNLTLAR